MRVQVVDGEFRVVLPPEAVEALNLKEGAAVEINNAQEPAEAERRYLTLEEGMKAYFETLPDHEASYRELAK